jgi:hypothetical protein
MAECQHGAVDRPAITPDLKVSELLRLYPELEDSLIALSPEFKRLKNPILRKTVARLATLRQVAKIGGVPLGTLIGTLRTAAGQADGPAVADEAAEGARPAWAGPAAVTRSFDARALIEDGGHPLEQVMAGLAELQPGQVFELVTPFAPEPLKDVAARKGFPSYSATDGPSMVRTYFRRA